MNRKKDRRAVFFCWAVDAVGTINRCRGAAASILVLKALSYIEREGQSPSPTEFCFYSASFSARYRATKMPLALAWDREWVTPLPSPMTNRPLWGVSRCSSSATSML